MALNPGLSDIRFQRHPSKSAKGHASLGVFKDAKDISRSFLVSPVAFLYNLQNSHDGFESG